MANTQVSAEHHVLGAFDEKLRKKRLALFAAAAIAFAVPACMNPQKALQAALASSGLMGCALLARTLIDRGNFGRKKAERLVLNQEPAKNSGLFSESVIDTCTKNKIDVYYANLKHYTIAYSVMKPRGVYIVLNRKIYTELQAGNSREEIKDNLSPQARKYVFAHELGHAVNKDNLATFAFLAIGLSTVFSIAGLDVYGIYLSSVVLHGARGLKRIHEFRADIFSAKINGTDATLAALKEEFLPAAEFERRASKTKLFFLGSSKKHSLLTRAIPPLKNLAYPLPAERCGLFRKISAHVKRQRALAAPTV